MDWLLDSLDEDDVCHVYPETDIHVHATGDDEIYCWCTPEIECDPSGAILIIHSSEADRVDLAAGILNPN